MDELLDFIPGGPWVLGAVALLAVPGIRQSLRPLAKGAIKMGMSMADQVKSLSAEAREQANDLYEEAKTERDEARIGGQSEAEAPARGEAGTASTGRARRADTPATPA